MNLDELDRLEEIEIEEAEEARKLGHKKIVNDEKFAMHFNPSDCMHCMNYILETDACKVRRENNRFYAKENLITDNCEEWEYVYTTKDGD